MYTNVATNLEKFEIKLPVTIVPIPKDSDYTIGFIRRYFAQRASDFNGYIFEISYETYDELFENTLWNLVELKWRIKGPIDTTYKQDGSVDDIGVKAANITCIANASNKLKNIGLYLPNILQFYK